MKVLVIGSGLTGLTSAWYLRRQGHEVAVVDRAHGPGLETSFANGAMLTPSMAEPWNAPGSWRTLLSSLGRPDAAMQLRLRAVPSLIGWGPRFLWNARAAAFTRNARANLRLALASLDAMEELQAQLAIDFGQRKTGALRIFRDEAPLDLAYSAAARRADEGLTCTRLTRDETVSLEPGLAPIADGLQGSIFYPVDQIGDAYRFCVGLAARAAADGVAFHHNTVVTGIDMRAGRVAAVDTDHGPLTADCYLVAAGSYSVPLLHSAGVTLPVRPAKGYSMTFADRVDKPSLRVPVVDDALHAVLVPLEGAIRVAGTAEFAGYDLSLPRRRTRNLLGLVDAILPWAGLDPAQAMPWCGLRAMSVDGVPIIGATGPSNLFVNSGHGHLGWTMAAASGRLVAELMSGAPPSVDPAAYAFARFGARRRSSHAVL